MGTSFLAYRLAGFRPSGLLALNQPDWSVTESTFDFDFINKRSWIDNGTSGKVLADGNLFDDSLTFTRSSSGSYFDSAGALQTAATNVLRFDHNPSTLEPKGILIEGARTNLLLNSATLSTQSVTVTAVAHTLSFYGTGTVTLSGASTAGPLVGTGAFPVRSTLTFTPTAGSLTLTVSGSVTLAQLEIGSFASSYINTTESSATRDVDLLTAPVGNWFNASEGTFIAEWSLPGYTNVGTGVFQIDDGSSNNRHLIVANSVGSNVQAFSVSSGVTVTTLSAGPPVVNAIEKAAYGFKEDNFAFSRNGAATITDTSGSVPSSLTVIRFGTLLTGISQLFGCLRRISYIPRRVTNNELERLSS